jgi:hypothetical protein
LLDCELRALIVYTALGLGIKEIDREFIESAFRALWDEVVRLREEKV